MEPKNDGTGASRMRILMVGALLLMSLLFVGTIQADEGGAAGRAQMDGTTIAVNTTFGAAPTVPLVEGGSAVAINLTGDEGIFDILNDTVTHTFEINWSGAMVTDVTDDANVTVGIASGVITFTPTGTLVTDGTTMISVYGTNNATDYAMIDITVTVTAVNDMPVITAVTPFDATQGTEIKVELNGTDEETDWTAFTFTILNETGGDLPDSFSVVKAGDDSSWLVINATNDDAVMGSYLVNITLTDGGSATDETQVEVTIVNANDAPVLPATWPEETAIEDMDTNFLIGPVTDPDLLLDGSTEAFTYTAYLYMMGANVEWMEELPVVDTLDAEGGHWANISFMATDEHVYYGSTADEVYIFLEVKDAAMAAVNMTFDVAFTGINDMPWIEKSDDVNASQVWSLDATQDQELVITLYGFDNDTGSTLTWGYDIYAYSGSAAPTGVTYNETAPMMAGDTEEFWADEDHYFFDLMGYEMVTWTQVIFTPVNADVGFMNMSVTLTDGDETAMYNISVNIANVNDAPTMPTLNAPADADGDGTEGDPYKFEGDPMFVELTGGPATDIDTAVSAETLTYKVNWDTEGGATPEVITPGEDGNLAFNHTYDAEGVYYVNLTVTDSGGLTMYAGYWINVTMGIVDMPPTVDTLVVTVTGMQVTLTGTYTDDGGADPLVIRVIVLDADGTEVYNQVVPLTGGVINYTFDWPADGASMNIDAGGVTVPSYTFTPPQPPVDDEEDDEEETGMFGMDPMMDFVIIGLIAAIVVVLLLVMMMKAKKKKKEEEERRRKEEEAAAAVGPAMERAASLQMLSAQSQLDLSPMQPQYDDAVTKQGAGDNIGAVEVITAYNTQIEQSLAAQGVDVEGQLAAIAAQQQAGEMPPDQAAAMGAEGQMPDQAAMMGVEQAPAPDQAAAAPDQSAPCPFCQNPLAVGQTPCPACGNAIQWG